MGDHQPPLREREIENRSTSWLIPYINEIIQGSSRHKIEQLKVVVLLCAQYGKHKVMRHILEIYPDIVSWDDILCRTTVLPNAATAGWILSRGFTVTTLPKCIFTALDIILGKSITKKRKRMYMRYMAVLLRVRDKNFSRMEIQGNELFGLVKQGTTHSYNYISAKEARVECRDIVSKRYGNLAMAAEAGDALIVLFNPRKIIYPYTFDEDIPLFFVHYYDSWQDILPLLKVLSLHSGLAQHKTKLLKQTIEIIDLLGSLFNGDNVNLILSFVMRRARDTTTAVGPVGAFDYSRSLGLFV